MVSQSPKHRSAPVSRDRLLAAAAQEFAARGFDGAKVDRIAAAARLNKAMLYYHFRNKAALYRAILNDLFGAVATAVVAVRQQGGSSDDHIRRFIQAIAAETARRPHIPAIWLREMAEGGRHLDQTIGQALRRILETLAGILHDGRVSGAFGPAHPFVTQMGIVAPLLVFSASARMRERMRPQLPPGLIGVTREEVVRYVEAATLAVLRAGASAPPGKSATTATTTRRRQ
jgi:TetR/AcrR family transcriptional regulator